MIFYLFCLNLLRQIVIEYRDKIKLSFVTEFLGQTNVVINNSDDIIMLSLYKITVINIFGVVLGDEIVRDIVLILVEKPRHWNYGTKAVKSRTN